MEVCLPKKKKRKGGNRGQKKTSNYQYRCDRRSLECKYRVCFADLWTSPVSGCEVEYAHDDTYEYSASGGEYSQ